MSEPSMSSNGSADGHGAPISETDGSGWSNDSLQDSEMRVELVFITCLCSVMTLSFIVSSFMSICKAKMSLSEQAASYKARNPLYNIILWYLVSVACYTITIFAGSILPSYAPFFDIALDMFLLLAIIFWLIKWHYRMEMAILIDYLGNLLKLEANGQKKLLRKVQSLYCQIASFDSE